MFSKKSLRDRLVCFAEFVRITLLAVLLLLQLPNCFFRVCVLSFFDAILNFIPPLTASATLAKANSNKSKSTRFTAGTIHQRKKERRFFQQPVQFNWIHFVVIDQYHYRLKSLFVLKQPSCRELFVRNVCSTFSETSERDEWYRQIQGMLSVACAPHVNVKTLKNKFEQCSYLQVADCLKTHVQSTG